MIPILCSSLSSCVAIYVVCVALAPQRSTYDGESAIDYKCTRARAIGAGRGGKPPPLSVLYSAAAGGSRSNAVDAT